MSNPISQVYICKNPYEQGGKTQPYFGSKAAFWNSLQPSIVHSQTNMSHLRRNKPIEIECHADKIIGCNYCVTKNTSNELTFYYITNITYVNDICTRIEIEEDMWSNWIYSCNIGSCFVEREHVTNDAIGVNILDEDLPLGEFVYDRIEVPCSLDDSVYLVGAIYDTDGNKTRGTMIGGTYVPCSAYVVETCDQLNSLVEALTFDKDDAILFISIVPKMSVGNVSGSTTGTKLGYTEDVFTETLSVSSSSGIVGYTPRNNKLLTYPYCSLIVDNNNGSTNEYMYEYFSQGVVFELICNGGANPQAKLVPKGYKGVLMNYLDSLSVSYNSPVPFTVDTFNSWLSNNMINIAMGGFSTVLNASAGNVPGAFSEAMNMTSEIYQHARNPVASHGGSTTNGLNAVMSMNKFCFYRKCITPQYAAYIDDYFDKFGYKVNKFKVPNVNTRAGFNFVKTQGSNVTGSVPPVALKLINSLFDNGVTLVHN